jgi:hypothetical protein
MAEKKRYRAKGTGLVSHLTLRTFVGYRPVRGDATPEPRDVVVPDGMRFRWMPDGEVLTDSAYLRVRALDGDLEVLPLELPESKPTPAKKDAPKGAGSEV